ncbi:asparaginase [Prochlorococcus marinus]|uniref:asparaginase n=1 Tax=Prochlorococcus marinus TaxID=1219 RepID=UPI0022B2F1DA|nr:asparaginase [Prochlorococcus marinus]
MNLDNMNRNYLRVYLKRNSSIESVHIVNAVICDKKGRILMKAGDPKYTTFIRSALKPFQAIPFVSSGAYKNSLLDEKTLAIACSSHAGTTNHARQSFKILWYSKIEASQLQCPIPEGKNNRLEHNCSGKHAAFLATCKKMNWPLNNYLDINHPLQIEINRRVSELIGIPREELISAKDDCGAPTLKMQLDQMALLYAHLGDSTHSELEQINRAMIRQPELIAGIGKFDTEVIKRAHGQLLCKGGSEGIQCISKLGDGMGIAIKVQDGSKRAKQAVALHLLKQLEWMTPISLQELEDQVLKIKPGLELEVEGQLKFQEN